MVLELIIIGGVIYYYTNKHHQKKKARRAAEAAAAAAGASPTQYPQQNKGNEAGGYSDLPSYGDARRQGPPIYEHGQARVVPNQEPALPSYAESAVGGNEKGPVLDVNEKSRTGA